MALDLCYEEDFLAEADFNIVLTDSGHMVEIQGATEADPFPRQRLEEVLALAARGMENLFGAQRSAIQTLFTSHSVQKRSNFLRPMSIRWLGRV